MNEINNDSLKKTFRPLQTGIIHALSKMRKDKETKERKFIAFNMLNLGNLIVNWKEIVGNQLALKTYPNRLMHRKLHLIVADSQWLQTLLFVKAEIINKLKDLYPELKIDDIIGKVGVIPTDPHNPPTDETWPNWQDEPTIETPNIHDEELKNRIQRCFQHASARIKGLEKMGYKLCKICRANPTRSENAVCAQCVFNAREAKRIQTMALLSDMPWLTYEEIIESDHELTLIEFDYIKEQLYNYSEAQIKIYGEELLLDYNENTYYDLSHEITRAIILRKGCMPDQVDLTNITKKDLPNPKWKLYLDTAQIKEE